MFVPGVYDQVEVKGLRAQVQMRYVFRFFLASSRCFIMRQMQCDASELRQMKTREMVSQ